MTPLAHCIVKELTLPAKRRTFEDKCGLLDRMDDVHCFEVSEIMDVAGDIAKSEADRGRTLDVLAFLPAPKTWIEWQYANGDREGVLLCEHDDGTLASARWAYLNREGRFLSSDFVGYLKLRGDGNALSRHLAVIEAKNVAVVRGYTILMYGILAMINAPRVIGRTTHMPHSGLQRKIAQSRRGVACVDGN
jgi:predicted nucleic acid-binding Zn ribbon protein